MSSFNFRVNRIKSNYYTAFSSEYSFTDQDSNPRIFESRGALQISKYYYGIGMKMKSREKGKIIKFNNTRHNYLKIVQKLKKNHKKPPVF